MSIVGKLQNSNKVMPNPNVLFECGYALNILGWERMALLFNKQFGSIENLPFDLNRRRISTYTANPKDQKKDLDNNQIFKLCEDILSSWIEKIDSLPKIIRKRNAEYIKQQRDIKNLKKFFSCFDVFSIQRLCGDLPGYINDDCHFEYIINIEYKIKVAGFHIYHEPLNTLIKKFSEIYLLIMNYWFSYEPIGKYQCKYRFINPNGDAPLNEELQNRWDNINNASKELWKTLLDILEIMRIEEQFIEVDIEALGNQAWMEYYNHIREIKKNIDESKNINVDKSE